jgi:hypothetical protein
LLVFAHLEVLCLQMGELLQSLIANKPMASSAAEGQPGSLEPSEFAAEEARPADEGVVDLT